MPGSDNDYLDSDYFGGYRKWPAVKTLGLSALRALLSKGNTFWQVTGILIVTGDALRPNILEDTERKIDFLIGPAYQWLTAAGGR